MSEFTAGPWVYENIPGQDRDGFPSHLHRIAQQSTNMMIVHMENVGWGNDPNARLIAAAPEMYEALRGLLASFDKEYYEMPQDDTIHAARAVLAKIDNA